ncbi:MAG TPA: Rap1a/Tai family immunity protein [Methylotenera sp.]|nr:Rap1a/Tai family immunity protein [Methylotenera sp.]HPV45800.1 Rap1a/Tai family immunity protein [Methylotenera sp.]
MTRVLLLATIIINLVTVNSAVAMDGNELLKSCSPVLKTKSDVNEDDYIGYSFCLGLMQGITNLNMTYEVSLGKKAYFCLPDSGIINSQAARIVVKFLEDNPQRLNEESSLLSILAFAKAYPCK